VSERKLTRVFCSRENGAHEVGAVVATSDGPRLRVVLAVGSPQGTTGQRYTFAPGDEDGMGEAWCTKCAKRLPLVPAAVLTEAAEGARAVKLTAEGMWRDPLGVLDRQRRADLG